MPHGKISYLEIPATDVEASAGFYQRIFGWTIRARGDGQTAFDDATGQVSGTWVLGRPVAGDPGVHATFRDPAGNVLGVFQEPAG